MDCDGIRDAVRRVAMLVNIEESDIIREYDFNMDDTGDQSCPVSNPDDVVLGTRIMVTVRAQYDPMLGITNLKPFTITSTTRRTILKEVDIEGNPGGGPPPNTPPVVTIVSPANNAIIPLGVMINFSGTAFDAEDGNISADLDWTIEDSLGNPIYSRSDTASFSLSTLAEGSYTITASVTDSGGMPGSDSIQIIVTNNNPPDVNITAPGDGSEFEEGDLIDFSATASDPEDGNLTGSIEWDSSIDGLLPYTGGSFSTSGLSLGLHTITASVTDLGSFPLSDSDSITILVKPRTPPEVTIITPEDLDWFYVNNEITFSGTAIDAKDGDRSVYLAWTSDQDGLIGSGPSFSISTLTDGWHTITASATDLDGLVGTDSIQIAIYIPEPPEVTILSPDDLAEYLEGTDIFFSGTATDYEDGDLTENLEWYSDLDGLIGTSGSFSVSSLTPGTHIIQARVTDSDDNLVWDSITLIIHLNTPPLVTIIKPTAGADFFIGAPIRFEGTVYDELDPDLLPSLNWYSSLVTGTIGTGGVFTRTDMIIGTHLITATVTDSGGKIGLDTRTITVRSNPCRINFSRLSASPNKATWAFTNISGDTYSLDVVTIPWADDPAGQSLVSISFNAPADPTNVIWMGPDTVPGIKTFGLLGPPTQNFKWIDPSNRIFEGIAGHTENLVFLFSKSNVKPTTIPGSVYAIFLNVNTGDTCTYSTGW